MSNRVETKKRRNEEEEEEMVVTEKKEALTCCVCQEAIRKLPHEGRLCLASMGMHWICISCTNAQKQAGVLNPLQCPLCNSRMDRLGTARALKEFAELGKKDNSKETFEALKAIWSQHSECLLQYVMYTPGVDNFSPVPYLNKWTNQRFVKWIFDRLYREDPFALLTWVRDDNPLFHHWLFRETNPAEFDRWLLMESPFQPLIISTDKLGPRSNTPYVLTTACVRGDRRRNINVAAEWYDQLNIPIRTRVKDVLRALASSRLSDPHLLHLVWTYITNGHDVCAPDIIQEMESLSWIHEHGLEVIGKSLPVETKRVLWPLLEDLGGITDRHILPFITHWRPPGGTVGKLSWYQTLEGAMYVRSILAHADGRVVIGPETRIHCPDEQEPLQGQMFFEPLQSDPSSRGVYSVRLAANDNAHQSLVETVNCQLRPNLFLVCRPGGTPFVGLSALTDLNHIQTCDDFDASSVFTLYYPLEDAVYRFLGFSAITVLSS